MDFLGERCMSVDVNSTKYLDSWAITGSIKDGGLAAEAFGAASAFFRLAVPRPPSGDDIFHRAQGKRCAAQCASVVVNGWSSDAVPVYINWTSERWASRWHVGDGCGGHLRQNPARPCLSATRRITASAPTCGNCQLRRHGIKVLCDEARRAFCGAGCRSAAAPVGHGGVSMHKSGGSLTQSSFLLCGPGVNADHVRQIINLTQTTSASYLLISSLDISRRSLALNGEQIFEKVKQYAAYARDEISQIGDYLVYSDELINGDTIFDFDTTKLSVNTYDLGLAGIEVHDILHDEYDIQIEFGDLSNFLAYISIGDRTKNIERLIGALYEIRRRYKRPKNELPRYEYLAPQVVMTPQEAFYAEKRSLPLDDAAGHISGESLMTYPPGIPLLAPGEKITQEIVDFINSSREKGCVLTGTRDITAQTIQVMV